jgi:hypothetical protein
MAAKKKTVDVSVPVDATLKRLWDRHSKIIAAAMARDASAFDERWEAAAAIIEHDPPLHLVGGHKSVEEFFENVPHEAGRTAFRNRVAKYFSARAAARSRARCAGTTWSVQSSSSNTTARACH